MPRKQILYGVANYEEFVEKNGYFVDKTPYIETLEQISNPVMLRPRRFGKSLWCRILECYYNIHQKDEFEYLFAETYIGQNPTPSRNSYFVLPFDFSTVDPSGTLADIEARFNHTCNSRMAVILAEGQAWFKNQVVIDHQASATSNLTNILNIIRQNNLPPLYIIIDEYDNFANQLITANKDQLYQRLVADDEFLKTFFKTLKEGRKTGTIANVFITGVLPITMDDLASGFNIANFITLDPGFEAMLGFTQSDVDALLDEIYADYELDPHTREEVNDLIKNHYNGYHFARDDGEAVYNSTMLIYFLDKFTRYGVPPRHLTDLNLKTDISWVRRLTASNPAKTEAFVNQLTMHNIIPYNDLQLQQLNFLQMFSDSYFPTLFFYLGILTRHDYFHLGFPNRAMQHIISEYAHELSFEARV